MSCKYRKTCAFFNNALENMPTIATMIKRRYCDGDYENCARYMVATRLGADRVPTSLYPTHVDDAEALLQEGDPSE
jgi:hypothetical protein